jgi:membrane-associated phospholipid phosphatase
MFIKGLFIICFLLVVVSLSAQESVNIRKTVYSGSTEIIQYKFKADNQIKFVNYRSSGYFSKAGGTSVKKIPYLNLVKKFPVVSPDSLTSKDLKDKFISPIEDPDLQKSKQSQESKESVKSEYTFQPVYNPLIRFSKDLWIQASSPFRMKGDDFLWLGASAIITAGLFVTDQASYNYIKKGTENTKAFRVTSPEITEFGANYGLLSLGAFAGYSMLFSDSKAQETSYLALESFLTSSVWVVGIKWIAGRQRPSAQQSSGSGNGGTWSGPLAYLRNNPRKSVTNYDAFPSGHTATAFSIATVIAKQYDNTLFVPVLSYAAATIVGITRIGESTHWASDVFVGAILGYLSATQIVHNNPSQYTRDHRVKTKFLSNVKTSFTLGMYESSPALLFKAMF